MVSSGIGKLHSKTFAETLQGRIQSVDQTMG